MQPYAAFFQVFFQRKHNVQRTVGNRKHTPSALYLQRQTQPFKKSLQAIAVQPVKRAVKEIRIARNIFQKGFHIAVIRHIAASLSCNQQLFFV